MRKFLITLLFLFGVSAPVFAQSPQITTQMTTTTTATGTGIAVPTTGYHMITWTLSGPAPTACTVAVDSSADNSSWTAGGAIPGQTCTSGGQSAVVNLSTGYIRINVTAFTGTGTLKVFYLGTSGIAGSSTTSTVSIGAPVGTCAQGALDTDKNTGNLYACNNGTWVLAGGGAGIVYSAGGGTAQAQTMTPSPASSSLNTGTTLYCWLPTAANTGAAPTLAISGLTAKPITKYGTVALVANDFTTAGIACVIYDGTEFQLQVPLAGGVYSSSLSLGSGASAAGATATGGFACVEAASTGWTPTAGQDYIRCDNTLHTPVGSSNGVAEVPVDFGTCATANALAKFSSSNIHACDAGISSGGTNEIDLGVSAGAVGTLGMLGATAEAFNYTGRTGVGFPVPYTTPRATPSAIAADLFPHGAPSDVSATTGVAWYDICSTDIAADGTNYECIRLGKFSSGMSQLSSTKGGTGTVRALGLQMNGAPVGIGLTSAAGITSLLTLSNAAGGGTSIPAIELQDNGVSKFYFAHSENIGNFFTDAAAGDEAIRGAGGAIRIGSNSSTPAASLTIAGGNPGAVTVAGALIPSQTSGITGTTTNNNANTGAVGEYVSSTIATGSSVTLSTGTTANVTSISLTAGDWDVTGAVDFTFGATTSYTNLIGSISSTSATIGAQDSKFDFETPAAVPTAGADATWVLPVVRFSLAGTTTVFLVAQGTFSVSTLKAYGTIRARRAR